MAPFNRNFLILEEKYLIEELPINNLIQYCRLIKKSYLSTLWIVALLQVWSCRKLCTFFGKSFFLIFGLRKNMTFRNYKFFLWNLFCFLKNCFWWTHLLLDVMWMICHQVMVTKQTLKWDADNKPWTHV